MFERERDTIRSALGGLREIEHIGSTAVPGLAAKPKIDILVGLRSWDDLNAGVDALLGIGYEHEPQLRKPRTFSIKRGRPTTHRVRFVERDGALWQELISFRDALRGDPDLADRWTAQAGTRQPGFGTTPLTRPTCAARLRSSRRSLPS
jgi:GrpB-like predicted nucleotidyltransferase (UPF0157 family)